MKVQILAALLAIVGVASSGAAAGPTTIGFNEIPQLGTGTSYYTDNFSIGGYRFSPDCHIDHINGTTPGIPLDDGAGIGWDRSGCDTSFNSNYLGQPAGPSGLGLLYIDSAGALFDLLNIDALRVSGVSAGFSIYSSKGGAATYPIYTGREDINFTSAEWKGVEWLVLANGGGGPNVWIDSITLSTVPEPGALALVAVAGVAAIRRRKTVR